MTYDIYFVRRRPGRTVLESIEDANEEMKSADASWMGDGVPEPVILTQQQRAAWIRIVQRAAEELGPVEVEEFLPGPTLSRNGPRGRLQLDYAGEDAFIAIPYWYWGEEAISVAEDAYRLARLVEEEGYSPELVDTGFQRSTAPATCAMWRAPTRRCAAWLHITPAP